ncbi:class E sortase [Actinomyces minihominis]|uniref:class E sortase n=1 Tax=Actinomyces minihominis TaxID=2002838 RepID=UPI001F5CCCB9|nr:class E sortase [Actinomyces minihominis]
MPEAINQDLAASPYPSRASRPPAPVKAKRKVSIIRETVGVIGELLITIGIFLALFIVWQLWWTSFKLEGAVHSEIATFQEMFPSSPTTTEDSEYTDIQRTDDPPPVGDVPLDEIYALLHVPRWDYKVMPVAEGTTTYVLDNGWAGHYPETQQAGEIGNFALAAHRRTYMNNFRRIDTLEDGDPIVVETEEAYLVYEVYGREIVDPSATRVVLPVPNEPGVVPTKRIMTMTTCHPEFGNSERFIVWSEMKYWVPKSEGKPMVLDPRNPANAGQTGE